MSQTAARLVQLPISVFAAIRMRQEYVHVHTYIERLNLERHGGMDYECELRSNNEPLPKNEGVAVRVPVR